VRLTAVLFVSFVLALVVLVATGHAQKSTWRELRAQPTGQVKVCWKVGHQWAHCTPPGDPDFLAPTYEEYRRTLGRDSDVSFWTEPYVRPGFFTVGSYGAPAPLRTNREIVRSKSFVLEEILMYGVTAINVQVTANERQSPIVPRHGELRIDAFLTLLPVSAAHFISRKYICQCVGDAAVAFATSYRAYGAFKGSYD
jgi:hypothetical protein